MAEDSWGRGDCYFILLRLWGGDRDLFERVVDFAGLAVYLLDRNGGRHDVCRELGARLQAIQELCCSRDSRL